MRSWASGAPKSPPEFKIYRDCEKQRVNKNCDATHAPRLGQTNLSLGPGRNSYLATFFN